MEPHQHRFCCFFSVDFSLWFLLTLPYWWDFFETVSLEYIPSHFALQACSRKLFFHHFLLVEGSQLFYIVSFIIWLVLLGVECSGLQELFEGWDCLYLHKIKHLFPVFLEPQICIFPPHKKSYSVGSCYTPLSCFLSQPMLPHFSLIRFFVCQTYAVIILKLHLFETAKYYFPGDCTDGCRFFCSSICRLCRCMYFLVKLTCRLYWVHVVLV